MALTASITTSDGTEHPNAFAMVYPVTLQVLPGDAQVKIGLHCWRDEASKIAGRSELAGYPTEIVFIGEAADTAIAQGLLPLAAIQWTGAEADLPIALDAVVAAIEDAVIAQRPEFSRAV